MAEQGTLYLIPTPLGNTDPGRTIPQQVQEAVESCRLFVVEKPKSAAQFLARMGIGDRLPECSFVPTNRLGESELLAELLGELARGHNIGVLSEAGCPGVADPGSEMVRAAHARGVNVVPLVGPSSIILALMASGLNGQEFAFHGYLPVKRAQRIEKLRQIEKVSRSTGQTQIFIETPHRNDHLFSDLLGSCNRETQLCVALDLTLPGEYIRTMSVAAWRRRPVVLGKRPAIFLINRPRG